MNNYEENFEEDWQKLKNSVVRFLKDCLSSSIIFTIIFLILKYNNIIDWNYFWICSPLWMPFTILIVIILSVIVFTPIINLFKSDE